MPDFSSTISGKIVDETKIAGFRASNFEEVAPSDIISNLFLEDLERVWKLKKWIPDPCNPHLHYLKEFPEKKREPYIKGDNST